MSTQLSFGMTAASPETSPYDDKQHHPRPENEKEESDGFGEDVVVDTAAERRYDLLPWNLGESQLNAVASD